MNQTLTHPDAVTGYGYTRLNPGIRCNDCGSTFPHADGSVMRGHALRCTVNPRAFHVPAVCVA